MSTITDLTAKEIAGKIKAKEISCLETVSAFLERTKKLESTVEAYNFIMEESALKRAKGLDSQIASGNNKGNLLGVPIAIKDNMHIQDVPTTCSSKILSNYVAPYNATVIEKLKEEGAVFIGKTNLDEFAMGSSTENSSTKTTKNPYNKEYIPGGSSGGSAAAVSSKMAPIAIGSDTGGSIRQPASCCGVVGMKPTYGRVSRYGLVAFASSLDQIGPFANNVEDASILLKSISGYDSKDSTSINKEVPDYSALITSGIKGMKIGLPKEYFIEGMNAEVKSAIEKAISVLKGLGAE